MEPITQEFLNELIATQEKLKSMYDKLDTFVCQNIESIDIKGQITNVSIENDTLHITSFGFDLRDECDKEYFYSAHDCVFGHIIGFLSLSKTDTDVNIFYPYQKQKYEIRSDS